MKNISIDSITEAVINHGDGGKTNPRLYQIYKSLIKHLHDFVREVNLTEQELDIGRNFLSQVARPTTQMPDGEIVMLTDILGISSLVDLLHHQYDSTVTKSALTGPVYSADAPRRQMGDCIGIDSDGDPLFISGYVLDPNGKPINNALIEVWQSNSKGLYDIQDPNQLEGNFRGCFQTNADGKYAFKTVVPINYDIQANGPSVEMLKHLGRHTRRTAHIHFKLSAAGFTSLTTQISPSNDDYIESDTCFSVMSTNIMELQKQQASDALACEGKKSFYTTEFNFVLSPSLSEAVDKLTYLKNNGLSVRAN